MVLAVREGAQQVPGVESAVQIQKWQVQDLPGRGQPQNNMKKT